MGFWAEGSLSAKTLRQGQVLARQKGAGGPRPDSRGRGSCSRVTAQEGTSLEGRGGRKPGWELSQ